MPIDHLRLDALWLIASGLLGLIGIAWKNDAG